MSASPSIVKIQSKKVEYHDESVISNFEYENCSVEQEGANVVVTPFTEEYEFKTCLKVPKTGLLLVGLGGNNGSTTVSAILANKHNISFETKEKVIKPNYYGSVIQSSTIRVGFDSSTKKDIYVPFNSLVPMVNPNDIIVGGWDINDANMKDAAKRSKVLDIELQKQLAPHLEKITPMPSIYYPDFIALNQKERANNIINTDSDGEVTTSRKWDDVEKIRKDIREFKEKNNLDSVIVLWTANTERFSDVISGVNDTADNILRSIKANHNEISPSTIFAVASILEKVPFINGSPQNSITSGVLDLADREKSFVGGDDFKTGQTKIKSVLAQYLVDAGIKPVSIVSYNHLGNNDGYNLSSPKQFRSKEISKQSVVDDIIESNDILYKKGEKVDHCIVIKYIPAVGDSKVAMDEYYSELMFGGHNRVAIHNTCEDSLLAVPIILDLVVGAELMTRISYRKKGSSEFKSLGNVLSFLSYWLKAPLTNGGFDPINGLNKQRTAFENLIKLLVGLPFNNELRFEERL